MPGPESNEPDPCDFRLLTDAVREAGALAMTMFQQRLRSWTKSDGSPVTEADLAVDRLLRTRLRPARPSYGWLSEETPDNPERLSAKALWIADPIDGTRSFMSGSDEWCVAVALAIAGRPVFGVVYQPVTGRFFEAGAGRGSRLNGRALRMGGQAQLDGARIAGSKGALKQLALHGQIEPHTRTDVPLALRLCYVASGAFDAALSTGNKSDWDLAAGDVIVHEAGGKVTDLEGRPFVFNGRNSWQKGLVAGNPALHGKMISVVGTSND